MRILTGMRWVAAMTIVLAAGAVNMALSWADDAGKAAEGGTSPAARRGTDLKASLSALTPMQTIAASDDPLTRARKERYNAALAQLVSQQELFERNIVPLASTLDPLDRLARAGEPVLKREEYLRLLSEVVEVAKVLEAAAKTRHKNGVAPMVEVHDATFVRADLEVRLLEAQAADKK